MDRSYPSNTFSKLVKGAVNCSERLKHLISFLHFCFLGIVLCETTGGHKSIQTTRLLLKIPELLRNINICTKWLIIKIRNRNSIDLEILWKLFSIVLAQFFSHSALKLPSVIMTISVLLEWIPNPSNKCQSLKNLCPMKQKPTILLNFTARFSGTMWPENFRRTSPLYQIYTKTDLFLTIFES